VLSRTSLSYPSTNPTPNSRPLNPLQPLCPLFSTPLLYFQSPTASFVKKWGVGYTPATRPLEIGNIQLLFPQPSCNLVNAVLAESSFVFIALQIPFSANSFFSQPSELPGGVGSRACVRAKPLLELRRQVAAEVPAERGRDSKYVAAKLSVARMSGNEQKLRSAGILYRGSGNTGFSACSARAKAMSFSETLITRGICQDRRTQS
jgi:hypothetical protein